MSACALAFESGYLTTISFGEASRARDAQRAFRRSDGVDSPFAEIVGSRFALSGHMPANLPIHGSPKRTNCAVLASLAVASVQFSTPGIADAQTVDLRLSAAGDRDSESSSVRTAFSGMVGIGSETEAEQIPDDAPMPVLFYRGIERGAVDEIGLEITGELIHAEASGENSTDFFLSQRGYAEAFGWRIEQTASYQSPTQFNDAFWRSSRELGSVKAEGTVPPMFALGHPERFMFWAAKLRVAYGELLKTSGGEIGTAGFDLDVDLDWFGIQSRYLDLGIFRTRLRQYGVPLERNGNVLRGLSVSALDFEIVNGAVHVGDVSLSAEWGVGLLSPVSPFTSTTECEDTSTSSDCTTTVISSGPTFTIPILWFGASWKPDADDATALSLGGGAFSRVSPDGYAADSGARVTASASTGLSEHVSAELTLDVATLKRGLVAADAPADVAAKGSKLLLARANGQVSIDVTEHLRLETTAYAERTDRDDPRRHLSAPNPDTWGYGLELAATYAFDSD